MKITLKYIYKIYKKRKNIAHNELLASFIDTIVSIEFIFQKKS